MTTLNELVAIIAEEAGVKPLALHLPVWPFWIAGAACEAMCAPLGIEPPLYRRRVDFFTKSRAFDIIARARELGLRAARRPARGHPPHAGRGTGDRGMALRARCRDSAAQDDLFRARRSPPAPKYQRARRRTARARARCFGTSW